MLIKPDRADLDVAETNAREQNRRMKTLIQALRHFWNRFKANLRVNRFPITAFETGTRKPASPRRRSEKEWQA